MVLLSMLKYFQKNKKKINKSNKSEHKFTILIHLLVFNTDMYLTKQN